MNLIVFLLFPLILFSIFTPYSPAVFAPAKFWVLLGGAVCIGAFGISNKALRPAPKTALLLLSWLCLSTAFSSNAMRAILGIPSRHIGLAFWVGILSIFIVVSGSDWPRKALSYLALATVPASCYAWIQYSQLDPLSWTPGAPASTVGNPIPLGALLALALPLTIALAQRVPWWSLLTIWTALAILTTFSKGAWMAAVLSVGTLLFLLGSKALWKQVAGATSWILLAFLISLLFHQPLASAFWARLQSPYHARALYQSAAVRIVAAHPVFGTGFASFDEQYPTYRSLDDKRLDLLPTVPHSTYLQIAQEAGIPALVLYCTLIYSALRKILLVGLARKDSLLLAVFSAGVGYYAQACFSFPDLCAETAFWLILAWALAECSRTASHERALNGNSPTLPPALAISYSKHRRLPCVH